MQVDADFGGDDVFDLSRSVRDRRWLYIRNFMPHLSWMPPERYSDNSTFRQEFKRLADAGALEIDQLTYAAPRRALEELYDTASDPHQLRNLAASAGHRHILERMRAELRKWQMESRDAGFLTEPQMWQRLGDDSTPFELALQDERYPLADLLAAANLVGRSEAWPLQVKLLSDDDDAIRYWGAVGLHAAEQLPEPLREALQHRLSDDSPAVRIEAAAALAAHGDPERSLDVLAESLGSSESEEALHAARALELLGEVARPAQPAMQQILDRVRSAEPGGDILMFIQFSLEAALERLAE